MQSQFRQNTIFKKSFPRKIKWFLPKLCVIKEKNVLFLRKYRVFHKEICLYRSTYTYNINADKIVYDYDYSTLCGVKPFYRFVVYIFLMELNVLIAFVCGSMSHEISKHLLVIYCWRIRWIFAEQRTLWIATSLLVIVFADLSLVLAIRSNCLHLNQYMASCKCTVRPCRMHY